MAIQRLICFIYLISIYYEPFNYATITDTVRTYPVVTGEIEREILKVSGVLSGEVWKANVLFIPLLWKYKYSSSFLFFNPVGWSCTIHLLHLCRRIRSPLPSKCPGYDTKQSDGEAPVVLELWEIWSTCSLSSLPGPLWPGVVVPHRVPFMDQIKLFDKLCANKRLTLNQIVRNITVFTFNWVKKWPFDWIVTDG